MALARTWSVSVVGLDATVVEVEVDVSTGLPHFTLTALADPVLRHVEHRLRAALANSGAAMPSRKVTVALLPATVPTAGSRFDLAVALALLVAAEVLPVGAVDGWVVLGELALSGKVKGITGVLPSVIGARKAGRRRFIVPRANYQEARLVPDAEVVPVSSLREVCSWLRGEAPTPVADDDVAPADPVHVPDLADVVGQQPARRAVEVAAAGGHHMFLVGPPGVGKTMLAERLPGLLPDLTEDEALEVTGIYSIAGQLAAGRPLITRPPFSAPHHTASTVSIAGGGKGVAAPGAVSLAHRGVLFLDEAPEFGMRTLDTLRQPLESGSITLLRAAGVAQYPCRFLLVLAANPCACSAGGENTDGRSCSCGSPQRMRYLNRISGPLRDRIDLNVELDPVSRAVLEAGGRGESTARVRERVLVARERAQRRLAGTPWSTMAEVPGAIARNRWPIEHRALRPLFAHLDAGGLSTRGLDRIVKLAWTLADLAGRGAPTVDDVQESLAFRKKYNLATARLSA